MAGFGFRQSSVRGGGENYGNALTLAINASYATKIYKGDPIKLVSGYVNIAAAGDAVAGVFNGCRYQEADGDAAYQNSWQADATAIPLEGEEVILADCVDPEDGLFIVKLADAQGALAQSMVGERRDHVVTAGDDKNGQSSIELGAAGASGGWQVIRLMDDIGTVGGRVLVRPALTQGEPNA